MSILHRGGMCHRFLPVPLSSGAAMRIRGQGPFLRASIHISGPGRVQSARVYRHTGIHIYMHTPAHRGAAGRPQGSRLRPNAGAGPFCGPWYTPCAAANSVSGPRKVRAGPGVPALRAQGAPERTHQASCCPRQPLAGMLSGGHLLPRLAPAPPGVAALGRASGATPAPSYALASPSRLRHGRTPATSCLPRGTFADPSRTHRGIPRPRNPPAQPQPGRPTTGRFRRGLGVMRARPRFRPGRGPDPSQKKM